MNPSLLCVCLVPVVLLSTTNADDWPVWRGPNGNGISPAETAPAPDWASADPRWKSIVPGRGHASPVVSGDLVAVATATDDGQFLLAYDRADGTIRWKTRVHEGGLPEKLHKKNTAASSTPAADAERFYVLFHNGGRLMLTAVDRQGSVVWQTDTGSFVCDYNFGYGASPTLHGGKVIVASECGDGYLAAFSVEDGSEIWRTDRKIPTTYSSPIVAQTGGREQLLISGAEKIWSYDPETGSLLWSAEGTCPVTCGTMVWNDEAVFASGGYPTKKTVAMKSDGSGEILWENDDKSYEQSLLYHDGHIYTLNDGGIAICWDAATGEEKWKERLGGPVSASPVLASGLIHVMNERSEVFVFRPDPKKFELVSKHQIGDEGFATPAFSGNSVIARIAEWSGEDRQEYLVSFGE